MSKYLICSDIHGDAACFKKIMEEYSAGKYKKLIILGDLLYHGPRNDLPAGYAPKEVIALANSIKKDIVMVKGNCEAEVDQMVLDFHIYTKKHLILEGKSVYLEHGHHLVNDSEKFGKGSVVFYGHTHVPKIEFIDGVYYINPGSVSIPKENSEKSYIVFDGGTVSRFDLDGREIESKKL